jgi:hypothetical protein
MSWLCLVVGIITPSILAVVWAIHNGGGLDSSLLIAMTEISVFAGTLISLINILLGLTALEADAAGKGLARAGIILSAVTLTVLGAILTVALVFA